MGPSWSIGTSEVLTEYDKAPLTSRMISGPEFPLRLRCLTCLRLEELRVGRFADIQEEICCRAFCEWWSGN